MDTSGRMSGEPDRPSASASAVTAMLAGDGDPRSGLRAAAQLLAQCAGAAGCRILGLEGPIARVWAEAVDGSPSQEGEDATLDPAAEPLLSRVLATQAAAEIGAPPRQCAVPLFWAGELVGIVDYSGAATAPAGGLTLRLDRRDTLVEQLVAGALARTALSDRLERRERERVLLSAPGDSAQLVAELYDRLWHGARQLSAATGWPVCDIYAVEGARLRCVLSVEGDERHYAPYEGSTFPLADYPASRRAVEGGRLVWVGADDDPLLAEGERRSLAEWGYHSWMAVPLRDGGHVVGLAELCDYQPHDSAPDAQTLEPTGAGMARDLHELLLQERVDLRERFAGALLEVAQEVSADLGARGLARSLARAVHDVVGAADCDVWKLEGEELRCAASWDDDGLDRAAEGQKQTVELYTSSRAALRERRPAVVQDYEQQELSETEHEVFVDCGFRSSLTMPLIVDDRLVGLIDVYDRRARDYAESLSFIISAGQLVAGAFANAWLAEQLQRAMADMHSLVDAGSSIGSSLDFDEVMRTIAARMCEVAHAAACDLYTVAGDEVIGQCAVFDGELQPEFRGRRFSFEEFYLLEQGVAETEIVEIRDVREDPRVSQHEREEWLCYDMTSGVLLPLRVHGELVGQALINDRQARSFEPLEPLLALAQIAAQAIVNARQFRDLQDGARRLALVNEAGLDLSSSLDVERVLAKTAERLCEVIDVPRCDVYLRDDAETVHCVASFTGGVKDMARLGRRFSLAEWDLTRAVLEHGETLAAETSEDPRLGDSERRQMLEWGERSALLVPLRVGDQTIGDVELFETRRQRVFTADEKATVEAVCRVAALAIENARLFEQTKSLHLENLRGLTSALTAKDYYTLGHAGRVSAYMALLGEELGWDKGLLERVEEATYLHDIGKIGVSDTVLLKRGPLSDEEWEQIRQHPVIGADILQPLFDDDLVATVRHHHERWDGTGYPEGLVGTETPEMARALCVVDAYDAMSYAHPYHESRSYSSCVEELERCAGKQFDAVMVQAFLRVLGRLRASTLQAQQAARVAAEGLDPEVLGRLRAPSDEELPEYAAAAEVLRTARGSNPAVRYMQAIAARGKGYVIVAEAEEAVADHSPIGEEVFPDESLRRCFAGEEPDVVLLGFDQWGVWVSGVAPVYDAADDVAFVVMADIPVEHVRTAGVRSDSEQPLASLLHAAAVRLTRAEMDAITDGLTGLYNHRHLQDRLAEEAELARSSGGRLAVLFCDLDWFKQFNDTYGHRYGDGVLLGTAGAIESCVRRGDVVARYGGEEFVVVLDGADETVATEVAGRIRAAVADLRFEPADAGITISVGIALCPEHGCTREELLSAADTAMYAAKACGRDRVVVSGLEPPGVLRRVTDQPADVGSAAGKASGGKGSGAARGATSAAEPSPAGTLAADRRRAAERRAGERREGERRVPRQDRRSRRAAEPGRRDEPTQGPGAKA
jgi:diguanylate cyclase (GGDEF)-like protein